MANFCKLIVPALIAFLVTQISWADERLVEGKESCDQFKNVGSNKRR